MLTDCITIAWQPSEDGTTPLIHRLDDCAKHAVCGARWAQAQVTRRTDAVTCPECASHVTVDREMAAAYETVIRERVAR